MLTSITPLGERSRGQRWSITVVAFMIGGSAGGATMGAVAGVLGQVVNSALHFSWGARLEALGVVVLAGFAADLRILGAKLPTPIRQVNENWLYRYRGWVYGLAFGFELGVGAATIVTTSAVYATIASAFLSGSVVVGVAAGAAFGLLRTVTLLAAARVDRAQRLAALGGRINRFSSPSRSIGLACQAATGAFAVTFTLIQLA